MASEFRSCWAVPVRIVSDNSEDLLRWCDFADKNGSRSRTSTIGTDGRRTKTTRSPDSNTRSAVVMRFTLAGLVNPGTGSNGARRPLRARADVPGATAVLVGLIRSLLG
jgi:hypothetical protein